MQDIRQREEKIQAKRMQTPWRDFVKELGSRGEFVLYKNQWLISRYPADTWRIGELMSNKMYEDYRQELGSLWCEIDEQIPFFQQFQNLFLKLKNAASLSRDKNENSDYADNIFWTRDTYLSCTVWLDTEKILYSFVVRENCKNVLNSSEISDNAENIYMSVGVRNSFNIFYARFIADSSNIWFSTNLIWCHECLFCDDLQNQSYCISNKQYDKETYMEKKQTLLVQKENFLLWLLALSKKWTNFASTDVEGNFIVKSHKVTQSALAYRVEQWRNLFMTGSNLGNKNMYDIMFSGWGGADDSYGSIFFGTFASKIYCSAHIAGSQSIFYSYYLDNCSYCLWCIGLQNKQFCIFNKEYTKEERFTLANKIFSQMESDWTLWSFFPGWMNPFYFNDTAAYLMDDTFTKEEVTKAWYLRRDEEIKVDVPSNAEVITTNDLDQYQNFTETGEWNIDKEILKKVIKDDKWNYYRIIPMELDFLQKHGLPLPEIHRLERIKLGFKFK